ncbi:MAG: hypothetical protein ACFFEN_13040 [Candidatus Thorarchaeota archaeon]
MKLSDQKHNHLNVKISVSKNKESIEKLYYKDLARYLKEGSFSSFKELLDGSVDLNIFIDVKKIPRRFNLISELLMECIDKVSGGNSTALGELIDILRFCVDYGLLEKRLSEREKRSIREIKKDKLLLANLRDLFNKLSDSFIFFIHSIFIQELYKHFMESSNEFYTDRDELMYYIKNIFFNHYFVYGLSVRYLSSVMQFMETFKVNHAFNINKISKTEGNEIDNSKRFIEFNVLYKSYFSDNEENREYREIKRHLVSLENILKNENNIMSKEIYNFYSISMILLGGLGPQGLGFTYSTPKGEIIEICSDQKETEAIIIKFKQFLKNKFLKKLEKELTNFKIKINIRNQIIEFLSDILDPKKLINYQNKDLILQKIKNYLYRINEIQQQHKSDLELIITKISNAIRIILMRIELRDQFMTRMDLVVKDKIKSKDIAKLTSLKGKSHYDVLRERFFYQYIVDWLYDMYQNRK